MEQPETNGAPLARRGELESTEDLRARMEYEAERTKIMNEYIRSHMKQDQDYGLVPGARQKSLWQPGAEKLAGIYKLAPAYEVSESLDPDSVHKWQKGDRSGETKGRYEVVATCTLTHMPTGVVVGSGVASCNSWESKYESVALPNVKNTVLQMAEKRAYVRAIRTACRMSMEFTQDVEDLPEEMRKPAPRPAAASSGNGGGKPGNPWIGRIKEITTKSGTGRSGVWTLFIIHTTEPGVRFGTFSSDIADLAQKMIDERTAACIAHEKAKKGGGLNIIELTPASDEMAETEEPA